MTKTVRCDLTGAEVDAEDAFEIAITSRRYGKLLQLRLDAAPEATLPILKSVPERKRRWKYWKKGKNGERGMWSNWPGVDENGLPEEVEEE